MTTVATDLQIHTAEREVLLQRLIKQLETDKRVVAAWLYGSFGRNEVDVFSDIDIRVIVADADAQTMNAQRREYATRIGVPLLVQEAPHNAPVGGAFLLVMYEGSVGPIEVDWTWQPQAQARIPPDAKVLFNRVGLAFEENALRPTGPALADALTEQSVFFWMMVQVAAKKIARQQAWTAVTVLNYVQYTLDAMKWLLELKNTAPFHENRRKGLLPAHPSDQMIHIRSLCREMETLTPQIIASGGQIPSGIIQPAYRFFDLIDAFIAEA